MDKRVIIPTIGRVMLFFPHPNDDGIARKDSVQPCRADVLFVNDDGTVNVAVTDHIGGRSTFLGVLVVQPDEAKPDDAPFCCWMEYQKGQAPSSDAVLRRLDAIEQHVGLKDVAGNTRQQQ